MLSQESNSEPPALTSDPTDKEKDIDVDTWEEGDSLASLLTAQVNLTNPTAKQTKKDGND